MNLKDQIFNKNKKAAFQNKKAMNTNLLQILTQFECLLLA